MRKLRSILIAALSCALILSLAACGGSGGSTASTAGDASTSTVGSESADDGVFRVGMECNYAPFNWTQTEDADDAVAIATGGYASGYDVYIAKRIAEGLGKELVIVKTEWDGLIPALQSGTVDAVIAGMSPTAERKETVDFSDLYYESTLVVVIQKDGKYADAKTLADFEGAKITGQLNTFHYTVIDQIPGVKKQNAMETFPAMIVALQSGSIDGYVSEQPGAVSAQKSNPDLNYIKFATGDGFETSVEDTAIAIALRKGDTNMTKMNEILKGISADEREQLMATAVDHQPAAE